MLIIVSFLPALLAVILLLAVSFFVANVAKGSASDYLPSMSLFCLLPL